MHIPSYRGLTSSRERCELARLALASIHSRKFRKLVDGKFIYIWTARLRDSLVQFGMRAGASRVVCGYSLSIVTSVRDFPPRSSADCSAKRIRAPEEEIREPRDREIKRRARRWERTITRYLA